MEGQLDPIKISTSDNLSVGVAPSNATGSAIGNLSSDTISPTSPTRSRVKPTRDYMVNDPLDQYPILTRDPLSEVTRRERKALLGLSLLAVA